MTPFETIGYILAYPQKNDTLLVRDDYDWITERISGQDDSPEGTLIRLKGNCQQLSWENAGLNEPCDPDDFDFNYPDSADIDFSIGYETTQEEMNQILKGYAQGLLDLVKYLWETHSTEETV